MRKANIPMNYLGEITFSYIMLIHMFNLLMVNGDLIYFPNINTAYFIFCLIYLNLLFYKQKYSIYHFII